MCQESWLYADDVLIAQAEFRAVANAEYIDGTIMPAGHWAFVSSHTFPIQYYIS